MKPSGVSLKKHYRFGDPSGEKLVEWGEILWKRLSALIAIEMPTTLRDRDEYQFVNDRLVNFLHARLVTRGVQIYKANKELGEDLLIPMWAEAVSDALIVSDDIRDDIAYHLARICPKVSSGNASLTPKQKKKIRRFASARLHRCYICGRHLEFAETEAKEETDPADEEKLEVLTSRRSFEIDHIFPQKRGGSKSPENLAACCEDCNKYKDVLLSFADFPIENAITSSVGSNVKKAFGRRATFALLWRQSGACAICDGPFHDAANEQLFLVRRSASDSYHSLNVDITCEECFTDKSLEGIKIRE